ncbi:hypothetical protein [Natrinema soli]|uniref:Fido domain-containing protein n=1 Tax=Natrinema soli TaxID=1930624 RepID=A0ABD5SGN0_9EURY|nr:hypothetical protein [Natrinema soli]
MNDNKTVLKLHDSGDSRYSLNFLADDKGVIAKKLSELHRDKDLEIATSQDDIGDNTIYLIYTKTPFESAYLNFESEEETLQWINEHFTEGDNYVLREVITLFDGIITEKEEQGETFSTYKKMNLEAIPDILNQVEWRQQVPDVGAELLSHFILSHPMPNTNHRTGIGLLDRYLSSFDGGFVMPDTGEEDVWYPWAKGYIYDSKRILTLRNHFLKFKHANGFGYEAAERKEGILIEFGDLDFSRSDYHTHYTARHLKRTREFVVTVLEEADATHLREENDDGKRAFIDRLREE